MKILFLISCYQIPFFDVIAGTIAISWLSDGLAKEISSEEFPFENIYNLSSGKDLKILNAEFASSIQIKRSCFRYLGLQI